MKNNRSENKQQFLDQKTPPSSYQLASRDLESIVHHYKEKNIHIFINGTTPFGQDIIDKKRQAIQAEINQLQNESIKYWAYFKKYWNPLLTEHEIIHYFGGEEIGVMERYVEIIDALSKFLIKKTSMLGVDFHIINPNLPTGEQLEVNKILSSLQCVNKLNEGIQRDIDSHRVKQDDICLDNEQARREINHIQESLTEEELVGYIFTNGHRKNRAHFESLIITRNEVINPIIFATGYGTDIHSNEIYSPNLDDFAKTSSYTMKIPCYPQTGELECGTLGILYIKELLKNHAQQLKEFTLKFSYYDDGCVERRFFLPSPHVLRYSQVSSYNKLLKAMLTPDVNTIDLDVHYQKQHYTMCVTTIKKKLMDSIVIAESIGDTALIAQNKKILADLPQFSAKWIATFREAEKNRNHMKKESRLNYYLIYRTLKMESIAKNHSVIANETPKALVIPTQTIQLSDARNIMQKYKTSTEHNTPAPAKGIDMKK